MHQSLELSTCAMIYAAPCIHCQYWWQIAIVWVSLDKYNGNLVLCVLTISIIRVHHLKMRLTKTVLKNLRQFISSLLSLQSASPSQRHFLWMHSPEPQGISLREHLCGGSGWRPHCSRDSSEWSAQSASSSHTQFSGMQEEFLHWNSWAPHVAGGQFTSSLPSLQSLWLLQRKLIDTQRPLEQVNSAGLQVTFPASKNLRDL